MASAKLAYRLEQGTFRDNQAQRLGQQAAAQSNSLVDQVRALNNHVYVPLRTDQTLAVSAAYATLLEGNINTILARGNLLITFTASAVHITNVATIYFQIVVDGVVQKGSYATYQVVPTALNVSMMILVPVVRGQHTVKLQWKTDNNSARINAKTIVEEHAHLLVQEAA